MYLFSKVVISNWQAFSYFATLCRSKGSKVVIRQTLKMILSSRSFIKERVFSICRNSLRDSLSSLPFLSDLDVYMSGGYEPEEVDAEIEAVDQFFVPTHEGKTFHKNGHM